MADTTEQSQEEEAPAIENLDAYVEVLAGPRRRTRQEASHEIALIAKSEPEALVPHIDVLIEALDRPEAQTRWEILDALAAVARVNPAVVRDAFEGAEASLFDDSSATVRLGAFRFLSSFGASGPDASDEAWPLLDEAVQCYHGDPEYHDMLKALLDFAQGNLSDKTRSSLISRMTFDAENGHGYIKAFSADIIKAAKGE